MEESTSEESGQVVSYLDQKVEPNTVLSFFSTLISRVKLEIKFTNSSWKHNRICRPPKSELEKHLQLLIAERNKCNQLCNDNNSISEETQELNTLTQREVLELCGTLVFDTLGLRSKKHKSGQYHVSITRDTDAAEEHWWQDFRVFRSRFSARIIKVTSEQGCVRAMPSTVVKVNLYKYERRLFSSRTSNRHIGTFYMPIEDLLRVVDVDLQSEETDLVLSMTSVWMPSVGH
ncbi:uncharacterized protein LOC111250201 [Varroa destructor]|uniref:Uncharacterized protein n=1 Tax=Varroa destructor TaxID=109461 RepID=A0A7M7K5T0_VARDE|nr:uncharacterized protein LOC111250201 [Varroa destructor]